MRSLTATVPSTQKKSSHFFLYFMLGIMILSSMGYAFLSSPATDQPLPDASSGPTGIQNIGDGIWTVNVYGASFQFLTDPANLTSIPYESNVTLGELVSRPLEYDLRSPGLAEALQGTIGQLISTQPICLGPCTEDVPERTCATSLVVWNQTASVNRIYQREQCIIIEGTRASFDTWIYHVTGLA